MNCTHEETWFQTFTGRQVCVQHPEPGDIRLDDVAHALARTCRFGGHVRDYYSVARHSVAVAQRVLELTEGDLYAARTALMHDAAEAYLGDVIRPLKMQLDGYKALELVWEDVIALRWGMSFARYHEVIKRADNEVLAFERANLLNSGAGQALGVAKEREMVPPLGLNVRFTVLGMSDPKGDKALFLRVATFDFGFGDEGRASA